MTCRERTSQLVECARGHASPDRELRSHISSCDNCRERWEAERQLTAHLSGIRVRMAAAKSPAECRAALMQEFSRRHRRKSAPSWVWSLAAAAAIVMALFIGHEAGARSRHTTSPAVRTRSVSTRDGVVYEVSTDPAVLSDDFVEIPYTPPLATGEMVTMIHTEMYPEALASMGVDVDPTWAEHIPVDLAVGQDGLTHAVRISYNQQ